MATGDSQASTIRERLAQRRRRRRVRQLTVVAVIAVLLAGFGLYQWYVRSVGSGEPGENVNVLVAVVDAVPEGESSADGFELQAALVVTLDPRADRVTVIGVPASTRFGPPEDEGVPTFAELYARGGLDGLRDVCQGLLDVDLHHYARVEVAGFTRFIDRLPGGVPVTVHSAIVYRDGEGNETFRLDPGRHVLDGEAALLYLRYRGGDWLGEVNRGLRHREFVQSLVRTVLQEAGLGEMRDFLALARELTETDLSGVQMVRLADMLRRVEADRVSYELLPGRAHQGWWVVDEARVGQMAARVFHPPAQPAAAGR